MKSKLLVGLIASLAATGAFAQSTVTVYGVIDTAIRSTTNQASSSGPASATELSEGAFQGNRLGFKGSEDLGGGTTAIFKLENGFVSGTGAIDQQGQIFGRQAWVGLSNANYGTVTLGRQYGAAFQVLGNYDPIGWGNFVENEWELFLIGIRFDNSVDYTNTWGPVSVTAQYSIGGQAGASSIGHSDGIGATYTQGPFSIGAVYQGSLGCAGGSLDATMCSPSGMRLWGIGGTMNVSMATLYLNYYNIARGADFGKAGSNSGGPLANTSMLGNGGNPNQRTDDYWSAGVSVTPNPAWTFYLAFMHDGANCVNTMCQNGTTQTVYFIADYNLSKRTDIYFEIDGSKVGGAEILDPNSPFNFASTMDGADSRTGVGLGLRTHF